MPNSQIALLLYEIEMTKISRSILYEKNSKEQIIFFETLMNNAPVYYTLKDLDIILSYENLIQIYKRNLCRLERFKHSEEEF